MIKPIGDVVLDAGHWMIHRDGAQVAAEATILLGQFDPTMYRRLLAMIGRV